MKFKKGIIIICLLICLFSITGVSASDINDAVVASDEQSDDLIEIESQYDVGATEEDSLSASDGTFTDLANEIANSTGELKLSKNYVYDSSKDSNYQNGILIDKEITINGRGFVINGVNQARAFNVSYADVILRNIEFTNCYVSGSGGAVYWNGNNGRCYDCNFVNCNSSGYGGAIYWNGKNGTLFESSFIDCSCSISASRSDHSFNSESSSSSFGYGGAVYWNGANGNIFNCIFNNCKNFVSNSHENYASSYTPGIMPRSISKSTSSSYGGAIYWNGIEGNIYNCDFIDCYSYSYSYSYSSSFFQDPKHTISTYRATSSSVCFSYSYGVYWKGNNGNLSGCSFKNSGTSSSSDSQSDSQSDPLSSGSVIASTNAISSSYGGAVYWNGVNGNIFDCNFITSTSYSSSSSSSKFGGAIYWYGDYGGILNCSFLNCHVQNYGYANAIYWYGNNGNLLNCSFINSGSSSSSSSGYKGAVYWSGDLGHLYNCSFNGNYYDYEKYCKAEKTVYPIILINTAPSLNNNANIVIIESTQLINNISASLYNVTDRKILYAEFNMSSEDLTSSFTVNDLPEGEYQLVLEYAGDSFYAATSANNLFKIGKNASQEVTISGGVVEGDNTTINVTLNEDATGKVKLTLSNYTFINELVDGKTSFYIPYVKGGINTYKIKYEGDNNYNPLYITDTIRVLYKSNIKLNLKENITFDENIPLNYTLTPKSTGNISVFLDNVFKANIAVDDAFELENISVGDHNLTVIYEGNNYYSTCNDSASFTVSKANPSINNINSSDLAGDVTFEIVLNEKATGNVTISINNNSYSGSLIDGKTNITVPDLVAGNHNCIITYEGNSNYNSLTLDYNFTLQLKNSNISIHANDIRFGETAHIVISMEETINDNVLVTVGTENYAINIINGKGNLDVSGLNVGNYDVSVIFEGNDYFKAEEVSTAFKVNKLYPFISAPPVTTKYGKDVNVTVNLAKDVPGNVHVTINGVTEKAKITNGVATYTVSGLKYGLYNVNISYAGNYKYAKDSITTTIKVNKNSPIVSVIADDCEYNENATVTVNLAQNVPGNVQITIDNLSQKAKITDGIATAKFVGLKRGTHEVTASYAGNVNYVAQTKTTTLNVVKGTPIISINMPDVGYGEDAVIDVSLFNDVPGNVHVTINGVTKKAKITNGKASYVASGLKRGSYDVTIYYAGNVNYNAQTIISSFNIVKGTPINSVSVDNINTGETAVVNVELANNVNGYVKITVNGVTQRVQIVDGLATCNVSNLNAGTYDVTATYAGNANYEAQTVAASLTVNKISPELTFSKAIVNGKVLITATIAKDAPGNVRITVNGVTYKAPISNGIATFTLPDLEPGSYVVEAKYAGNYKYLAETKTQTISVK